MSQPTPEMIRASFDAFNRRDYEAWLADFAEDCEGHDLKEAPDTDVYYGHAGLRTLLESHAAARREGVELELLPGPEAVQRVFEVAGLLDELPFTSRR